MINDPFDLQRFVDAQATSYDQALAELRAGQKVSHWMWYIFPQLDRPGTSPISKRFAIKNLNEARAYLKHPVLGKRLRECTVELLGHRDSTAYDILGAPDDLKLQSSATLFARASSEPMFERVLDVFFSGVRDPRTERVLDAASR